VDIGPDLTKKTMTAEERYDGRGVERRNNEELTQEDNAKN
jgi:hypothetical protein